MKIELNKRQETDAVFILVAAEVLSWKGAAVNGVEDKLGDLIPFRDNNLWTPKIHIDSGKIIGWTKGMIASIRYKTCDGCGFSVTTNEGEVLYSRENGYVPSLLSPKEDGLGDYIIMDVDGNGFIDKWDKSKFQVFLPLLKQIRG